MKREDKKKLLVNRRIIVNHLVDLESVLDYLIAKQIFTPAIRERIVYVRAWRDSRGGCHGHGFVISIDRAVWIFGRKTACRETGPGRCWTF